MNKQQALVDCAAKTLANMQISVDEQFFFDGFVEVMEKHIAEYRESLIPATPEEKRMLADSCDRLTDLKHL